MRVLAHPERLRADAALRRRRAFLPLAGDCRNFGTLVRHRRAGARAEAVDFIDLCSDFGRVASADTLPW